MHMHMYMVIGSDRRVFRFIRIPDSSGPAAHTPAVTPPRGPVAFTFQPLIVNALHHPRQVPSSPRSPPAIVLSCPAGTATGPVIHTRSRSLPVKPMQQPAALPAMVLALVLTACGDAPPAAQNNLPPERRVADRYDASLRIDLSEMQRLWSGLYVQDLQVGQGSRADSGDVVRVHYTGWLPNGRQFDSSRDSGKPFETALGYGRVIDAWDQGIIGMREGGRRRLVAPPIMGYGKRGSGPIPPNATLIFDVELLEVENRTPEAEPAP